MNRGLNLTELAAKLEANRTAKHDMLADTRELEMVLAPGIEGPNGPVSVVPELMVKDQGVYPLRPIGHDQIASRIGIPLKYYARMQTEAPELLATNVNTWFQQNPKKRLVRTLHSEVRAFLSNRYQRIENEEIASVALPILMEHPDIQIVSAEVTETRLYIQAVTPRIQGEVAVGDVVQAGVIIRNSEVGYGAVTVDGLDYRLRCLNGMVTNDGYRRTHVGKNVEDNAELWAEDTVQADDKAVLLKVRDMIRAMLSEERFQTRLNRMKGLTNVRVTGDPARVVEVLAAKVGANENERGGILRALIEGADLSAWGIVNAVTAQAHDAKEYDRAVDFEEMGGTLINLPANDWKEILQAA